MSRLFDDGAADAASTGTIAPPVTAAPLTLACWFYSDDTTVNQNLLEIFTASNTFRLAAAGAVAGDFVRATAQDAGGTSFAATSTGYSANTWHHGCAVFASNTSRTAYIDGGSSGNNTTSRTPAGVGSIRLSNGGNMSGRIAEAAIWSVALTAADVLSLARGFSPLLVRPEALEVYYPLIGNYSPEIDVVGGFNLTLTGTAKDVHPRVLMPYKPPAFWMRKRRSHLRRNVLA